MKTLNVCFLSELSHEADQLMLMRCLREQLKSSAEAAIILEQSRAIQVRHKRNVSIFKYSIFYKKRNNLRIHYRGGGRFCSYFWGRQHHQFLQCSFLVLGGPHDTGSQPGVVFINFCIFYANICLQVLVRYVDNEAETQWSTILGDSKAGSYSPGYSIIEVLFCE